MEQSLSQTVDVETPELVVLSYTIAGLGSRVYAAVIDLVICVVLFVGVIVGLVFLVGRSAGPLPTQPTMSTAWAAAVLILTQFAILWGYYVLFEGLRDGQTPGKRLTGLRVVRAVHRARGACRRHFAAATKVRATARRLLSQGTAGNDGQDE